MSATPFNWNGRESLGAACRRCFETPAAAACPSASQGVLLPACTRSHARLCLLPAVPQLCRVLCQGAQRRRHLPRRQGAQREKRAGPRGEWIDATADAVGGSGRGMQTHATCGLQLPALLLAVLIAAALPPSPPQHLQAYAASKPAFNEGFTAFYLRVRRSQYSARPTAPAEASPLPLPPLPLCACVQWLTLRLACPSPPSPPDGQHVQQLVALRTPCQPATPAAIRTVTERLSPCAGRRCAADLYNLFTIHSVDRAAYSAVHVFSMT